MATTTKKTATTTKKPAAKKPAKKTATKKPVAKKRTAKKEAEVAEPKEKFSVPKMVGERLIKQMQDYIDGKVDALPWRKPWVGGTNVAISGSRNKPYGFVNQMMLDRPGEWYTFSAIAKAGAKIKKGCHPSYIVERWWQEDKNAEPDPETGELPKHPVLRYFKVFHVDDIEGIEPRRKKEEENAVHLDPVEKAEKVIGDYVAKSGVKLTIRKSGSAYYSPANDEIVVPEIGQFTSVAEYYSTVSHEAGHSTGHEKRLKRINSTRFGSHEYSKEELVAEICAAALVNYFGIETKSSFENSVSYVQNWINALKKDINMAYYAAIAAEKAFNYIVGCVDEKEEKEAA